MLARLSCAQSCARCVVLSRHNFYVATQGLLALATPYRNSGLGRDTGLKGLCHDRKNLCHDPSHPVPAPNPVATPKFCRNTGLSNLYRERELSVLTKELWAVCRDRDFFSRWAFYLITPRAHGRAWNFDRTLAHTRVMHAGAHAAPLLRP